LVPVYGVVRTAPAAVVTPLLAGLGDRVDPQRLLLWTTGGRTVLLGLAAVSAVLGLHPAIVLSLAGAADWAEGRSDRCRPQACHGWRIPPVRSPPRMQRRR
jgi:hypothetical protein